MEKTSVTVFRPYSFEKGEKVRIDGGPRGGDWEVIGITDRKVTLRCPVKGTVVEWARFNYHVGQQQRPWPDRSGA